MRLDGINISAVQWFLIPYVIHKVYNAQQQHYEMIFLQESIQKLTAYTEKCNMQVLYSKPKIEMLSFAAVCVHLFSLAWVEERRPLLISLSWSVLLELCKLDDESLCQTASWSGQKPVRFSTPACQKYGACQLNGLCKWLSTVWYKLFVLLLWKFIMCLHANCFGGDSLKWGHYLVVSMFSLKSMENVCGNCNTK